MRMASHPLRWALLTELAALKNRIIERAMARKRPFLIGRRELLAAQLAIKLVVTVAEPGQENFKWK